MIESDAGNQPVDNPITPSSSGDLGQLVGYRFEASWSGPLPPPDVLQEYESVLPGAADRILVMAENVQQHNIDMEKAASERENKILSLADKVLASDASQSKTGVWLGFILAVICIGVGAWLFSIGQGGFGIAVIFTPLAGLAGVFVYGTRSRRAERSRNAQNPPEG